MPVYRSVWMGFRVKSKKDAAPLNYCSDCIYWSYKVDGFSRLSQRCDAPQNTAGEKTPELRKVRGWSGGVCEWWKKKE